MLLYGTLSWRMKMDHNCKYEAMDVETVSAKKFSDVTNETAVSDCNNVVVNGTQNSSSLKNGDVLSKKQRKRMEKKEKWLKYKVIKRAKEKEKLKIKKQVALLNNLKLGPSRKQLKHNKMSTSNCKVHVAIDLSFNDLMNDKDIAKCVKQVLHCYSINRKFSDPMQFFLTSFGGRFEKEMEKHDGFRNWDVNFSAEHFTKAFSSDRLVYLTSDSDNVINSLEDEKVYIIGGLVDHNSQKGMCLKVANDLCISHGQLPIGEYLQMNTRKTLTINHVFEIMHHVSHGKTWEEAFLTVIPARKGAQAKEREAGKQGDDGTDMDDMDTGVEIQEKAGTSNGFIEHHDSRSLIT
ncbi:hypothetical protein J437_LFUL011055 [Ladona fulva]|uniref:tRNA (guanine(9)-N(1))-methyltransferase n=1 Tax=Ladona fulva TaxID=123851 RepID=A0A8K0KB27_LADFU|nr:hypothetical protein J437_LFUL011055 [Ladona fulva]